MAPITKFQNQARLDCALRGVKPDAKLAEPVLFTCIVRPNMKFILGSEIFRDEWGKSRTAIQGTARRFYNTRFLATTEEELSFCRSRPEEIFEEPAEGADFRNKKDGFTTKNEAVWDAYMERLTEASEKPV